MIVNISGSILFFNSLLFVMQAAMKSGSFAFSI